MKEGKSKPKRKYITVYTFLMTQKYAKIWNSGICRVMRIQCRPSTSGVFKEGRKFICILVHHNFGKVGRITRERSNSQLLPASDKPTPKFQISWENVLIKLQLMKICKKISSRTQFTGLAPIPPYSLFTTKAFSRAFDGTVRSLLVWNLKWDGICRLNHVAVGTQHSKS